MVKLKTIEDLPPKEILISLIQQAMVLNENGIKKAKPQKSIPSKQLEIPIGLSEAFEKIQLQQQFSKVNLHLLEKNI